MNTIDWSKAPEGATHYRNYGGLFRWYRIDDNGVMCWTDMNGWHKSELTIYEIEGQLISRNSWSGEGLPPVGIDVEFSVAGDERWIEGEVLYLSLYTAVISGNGFEHVHHPNVLKFRPIRTPEQIAAEERDKARTEVLNAMTADGKLAYETEDQWQYRLKVVGEMLDMGYRKQEAK